MKLTKSQLREIIREEIKSLSDDIKIKKGSKVKIKSKNEIDNFNYTSSYKKYLNQIAGETVIISRAFKDPVNRGSGPLNNFEVNGYPLWNSHGSGFDSNIIDKVIKY